MVNFLILCLVTISIFSFAALAGAVGIGGGGFFTPILMLIGGLSIFEAIPIASVCIFGVGLASTLVNMKNHTINYRLGLILEPITILGTILGVQLHLIASEEIIFSVFLIIMCILTYHSYLHARTVKNSSLNNNSKINFNDNSNLPFPKLILGMIGSFTAGFISALIGIGGGLIKVPMLNDLGMSSVIASGTGSFMVTFTSFSTSIQFLVLQRLELQVGILFFIIGFFASFIGTSLSRAIKRPEALLYFLTLAIGISTVLVFLQWIIL
ncbi:sulfite exporter TauE/SafE family protein [Candidatus Hodarchaeum mangrovi]